MTIGCCALARAAVDLRAAVGVDTRDIGALVAPAVVHVVPLEVDRRVEHGLVGVLGELRVVHVVVGSGDERQRVRGARRAAPVEQVVDVVHPRARGVTDRAVSTVVLVDHHVTVREVHGETRNRDARMADLDRIVDDAVVPVIRLVAVRRCVEHQPTRRVSARTAVVERRSSRARGHRRDGRQVRVGVSRQQPGLRLPVPGLGERVGVDSRIGERHAARLLRRGALRVGHRCRGSAVGTGAEHDDRHRDDHRCVVVHHRADRAGSTERRGADDSDQLHRERLVRGYRGAAEHGHRDLSLRAARGELHLTDRAVQVVTEVARVRARRPATWVHTMPSARGSRIAT